LWLPLMIYNQISWLRTTISIEVNYFGYCPVFKNFCVLSLKWGMINTLIQQNYHYLLKFVLESTSWIEMYILTYKIYLEEKIHKIIVFVNLKFNLFYNFRKLGTILKILSCFKKPQKKKKKTTITPINQF